MCREPGQDVARRRALRGEQLPAPRGTSGTGGRMALARAGGLDGGPGRVSSRGNAEGRGQAALVQEGARAPKPRAAEGTARQGWGSPGPKRRAGGQG